MNAALSSVQLDVVLSHKIPLEQTEVGGCKRQKYEKQEVRTP